MYIQSGKVNSDRYKNISHKGINGREALKTLSNPDSLASTIVLETFVSGGRGINAYKRGGKNEFRERFTEDVVSAVFWMKGVDIFNKIGNFIGKKFLNIKNTEFDVGKDALRTPFQNLEASIAKESKNPAKAQALTKKLAVFKFTKIVTSAVLAIGFVGFVLPKINQAVTERLMGRNKMENKLDDSLKNNQNTFNLNELHSFEAFDKKISSKKSQSFKGLSPESLTTFAHTLENNRIAKMLTSDVGILTGRVATARNADEAREYAFRDSASSFFYYASTPLIYKGLQKLSGLTGITNIDPIASKQVHGVISDCLKNAGGEYIAMTAEDFAKKTIGVMDEKGKEILSSLPFNSDVISLKELAKHVTDRNLLKKAAKMSKLQPIQSGIGRVLTKQQVQDVLKNGCINSPEFMEKAYKSKFGEALTDRFKFIPMKKITTFRDNIEEYVQSVLKEAKKSNGGMVDKKLLDKINRKSFVTSAGFRAVAIGISAFALGFAIPKLQYAMTAKITGTNAAPGLRNYENDEKKA